MRHSEFGYRRAPLRLCNVKLVARKVDFSNNGRMTPENKEPERVDQLMPKVRPITRLATMTRELNNKS
jgi:hypothetical protein